MGDTLPLPNKAQTWLDDREHLESFAKEFDPAVKLAVKKSGFWIGALKANATTLGRTVYIPADWTIGQVVRVIPHEVRGHVKQFRYCGLGIHPNLGFFPGMLLLYVWGVVFPLFLAWGRYRLELHAESHSWRYHLAQGSIGPQEVRYRAQRFAKVVASWTYVKAWPESWAVWGFKRRAERVIREVPQ
jgi:hypothetical protein